jgi:hypothetical protein
LGFDKDDYIKTTQPIGSLRFREKKIFGFCSLKLQRLNEEASLSR